jgi:uncharacterized membrane protein YfcA
VLGATAIFALQGAVARRLRATPEASSRAAGSGIAQGQGVPRFTVVTLLWQFLVGLYGGYFGAGIGILMLAVLGFMGFSDIHQMNGLKNWGGLCINFVAALLFAVSGIVDWAVALAMAGGATAGGYVASRLAQRVPQPVVRRAVVVVGVLSGLWLLSGRLPS